MQSCAWELSRDHAILWCLKIFWTSRFYDNSSISKNGSRHPSTLPKYKPPQFPATTDYKDFSGKLTSSKLYICASKHKTTSATNRKMDVYAQLQNMLVLRHDGRCWHTLVVLTWKLNTNLRQSKGFESILSYCQDCVEVCQNPQDVLTCQICEAGG